MRRVKRWLDTDEISTVVDIGILSRYLGDLASLWPWALARGYWHWGRWPLPILVEVGWHHGAHSAPATSPTPAAEEEVRPHQHILISSHCSVISSHRHLVITTFCRTIILQHSHHVSKSISITHDLYQLSRYQMSQSEAGWRMTQDIHSLHWDTAALHSLHSTFSQK